MVPRGGIEPPTRGFSIHGQYLKSKSYNFLYNLVSNCMSVPIWQHGWHGAMCECTIAGICVLILVEDHHKRICTEDMTNYYPARLREPALFSAWNLAYRLTFKHPSFAECQGQVQTAAGIRADVRKWNDHKNSIRTYLCVNYTCSLCPKRATAWSSNCFKRKHRNITSAQDQEDERWWHSDYLSPDINGIWCKLWRFSGNEHETQPMC